MRILADENIPGDTVNALRALGHDVVWASVDLAGDSDEELLAVASGEQRLLLTMDKDFGELAFRQRLAITHGIILIRIHVTGARAITDRLTEVLQTRKDWATHFSVIGDDRVRATPIPGP